MECLKDSDCRSSQICESRSCLRKKLTTTFQILIHSLNPDLHTHISLLLPCFPLHFFLWLAYSLLFMTFILTSLCYLHTHISLTCIHTSFCDFHTSLHNPANPHLSPTCILTYFCDLHTHISLWLVDGCRRNEDCQYNEACVNRQCTNPCTYPDVCGVAARCLVDNHHPICTCPSSLTGDPNIQCYPGNISLAFSLVTHKINRTCICSIRILIEKIINEICINAFAIKQYNCCLFNSVNNQAVVVI